jgi:release factor glutamine methyltransferase
MLVDAALEIAGAGADPRTALRIADVGTGSGCLAVTLALEIPRAHVTATDISRAALDMAQRNAAHLGARVHFIETAFLGREHDFDLVVSNPPYVPESDAAALSPDVRDYEPAAALFGGLDGLSVIGRLLPAACAALRPGGWLVMEMGAGQSAAVRQLVAGHAWDAPRVVPDLAGIDRVLIVRRAAPSV